MDIFRIDPAETRRKVSMGEAIFVCAYENEQLCKRNHLQGAILLQEFMSRLPSLSKDQEIIFYCA